MLLGFQGALWVLFSFSSDRLDTDSLTLIVPLVTTFLHLILSICPNSFICGESPICFPHFGENGKQESELYEE